jgi:hypothetical protein
LKLRQSRGAGVDFHGPPPFYRRIAHPLGSDKVVLGKGDPETISLFLCMPRNL